MKAIDFTDNNEIIKNNAFMDYIDRLVDDSDPKTPSAIKKATDILNEIQDGESHKDRTYESGINDIQKLYDKASEVLNFAMNVKGEGQVVDWVDGTWALIVETHLDYERADDGKIHFTHTSEATDGFIEQMKNLVDEIKTDLDLKITDASEQSQKIQLIIQLASSAVEALGNTVKAQGQSI